jgi:hypothetical protein
MADAKPPPSWIQKLTQLATKSVLWIFTLIGVFCVGALLFLLAIKPIMYEREITKRVYSPDRSAVAKVEVTRGGFGTVWTTRVLLVPSGEQGWTVYETGDSDFTPPLRWASPDRLILGLPCERFGHVSNPDDWERSDPSERRFKVRFEYIKNCDK